MNAGKVFALLAVMVSLWLLACLIFALGAPAAACWVFIASGTLVVPIALYANEDIRRMEQTGRFDG